MPPYSNMDHSQSFGDSGYGGGGSSSLTNNPPQQRQPLHHQLHKSTSNVETHHGLIHLAALELEAMRSPPSSSSSPSSLKNRKSSNNDNDSALLCSGGRTNSDKNPSRGGTGQIIQEEIERSFPPACLTLLQSLPNNTRCHDCQNPSLPASWASVSYGITLCLHCSGKHRSLGVNCSFIKSLTLDSWKRKEILCMLEGGNEQLSTFLERHGMGGSANNNSTTSSSSRRESTGSSSSDDGSTSSVGILDRYKTKAASFYRQHLLNHARVISEKEGMYEGREASRQRQQHQHQSNKGKSKSSKSSGSSSRKKSRGGVVEQKKKKLASSLPTVTEKE